MVLTTNTSIIEVLTLGSNMSEGGGLLAHWLSTSMDAAKSISVISAPLFLSITEDAQPSTLHLNIGCSLLTLLVLRLKQFLKSKRK